jgi:peptidoglycan/xylan/chitin deacetylase (PgdA/CDA1 family)
VGQVNGHGGRSTLPHDGGRALILMYHQVDTPRSEREHRFCMPPAEFERQMSYLAIRYDPLSMDEMLACLSGQRAWPERPVQITFDDGFTGVLEHAAPMLAERRIPATLFAVSDRLGGSNDWMASRGFPERPLLTAAQLCELEKMNFTIGSHTRTHARLTELDAERARNEIAASKAALEDALGKEVRYFAYPYGLVNEAVRNMVAESGYLGACSTVPGFNCARQDPYMLRRIDVFGTDRLWQFRQKLRFGMNEASRLHPWKYYAGRIGSRLGMR